MITNFTDLPALIQAGIPNIPAPNTPAQDAQEICDVIDGIHGLSALEKTIAKMLHAHGESEEAVGNALDIPDWMMGPMVESIADVVWETLRK
jgi:hypothetical protein